MQRTISNWKRVIRNWIGKEVENKESLIIDMMSKPLSQFRDSRDSFLSTCISIVYQQHGKDGIDSYIQKDTEADNPVHKNFCEDKENIDPYMSFNKRDYSSKVECKVGEPDFLNLNSYKNIIHLLQNIGIRSGIKHCGTGNREWLFVECDGLPYNLIRDIIVNVWYCGECTTCFYRIESLMEHKCYFLGKSTEEKLEFDWIVPILLYICFT